MQFWLFLNLNLAYISLWIIWIFFLWYKCDKLGIFDEICSVKYEDKPTASKKNTNINGQIDTLFWLILLVKSNVLNLTKRRKKNLEDWIMNYEILEHQLKNLFKLFKRFWIVIKSNIFCFFVYCLKKYSFNFVFEKFEAMLFIIINVNSYEVANRFCQFIMPLIMFQFIDKQMPSFQCKQILSFYFNYHRFAQIHL